MGPEQERDAANFALAETARDTVDRICIDVLDASFSVLQNKLEADAEEIELYELSQFPADRTAELFVSPDRTLAPMYEDQPQETLTIMLERLAGLFDDSDHPDLGDRVRLLFPVPRDYHYPDLLDDEDKPTEMYIEVMPNSLKGISHARYIIERDITDPKGRYNLYEYHSAADGGEQEIHNAVSSQVIQETFAEPIPMSVERASRLLRSIGNFSVVIQKYASPHDPLI